MPEAKKTRRRAIAIQRAYEDPASADGYRILVDHFWPRGRSKAALQLATWARDVAPTPALIHWFGHDPERWEEFRRRYRRELGTAARRKRLRELLDAAGPGKITLVYGARNERENQAVVLREVLQALAAD